MTFPIRGPQPKRKLFAPGFSAHGLGVKGLGSKLNLAGVAGCRTVYDGVPSFL